MALVFQTIGTGPNIVFSHGTPTYSGEYLPIVQELKNEYCSVLIDHLGFGHSPKPVDADYSIAAHQKRFSETLLAHGMTSFHLVVHDFGGVIALPLLKDSRFKILSLTIMNSWYWPLVETEPQMKQQQFLVKSGLFPLLYRYLNFSPTVLYKMGWGKSAPFPRDRHQHYMNLFPTSSDRSGTIGFLRALFDFSNNCWSKSSDLSELNVPVQLVWGMEDKLISPRNLERWKEILTSSKEIRLENVGHFIADEAPVELTNLLRDFLSQVTKDK